MLKLLKYLEEKVYVFLITIPWGHIDRVGDSYNSLILTWYHLPLDRCVLICNKFFYIRGCGPEMFHCIFNISLLLTLIGCLSCVCSVFSGGHFYTWTLHLTKCSKFYGLMKLILLLYQSCILLTLFLLLLMKQYCT